MQAQSRQIEHQTAPLQLFWDTVLYNSKAKASMWLPSQTADHRSRTHLFNLMHAARHPALLPHKCNAQNTALSQTPRTLKHHVHSGCTSAQLHMCVHDNVHALQCWGTSTAACMHPMYFTFTAPRHGTALRSVDTEQGPAPPASIPTYLKPSGTQHSLLIASNTSPLAQHKL